MRELVTFTAVAVFVGAANLAAAGVSAAADLGGVHDRDMRDMRESMPMPVHLTNWTGFYIGAGVGGAMFSASDTEIIPGIGTDTVDFGSQGFLGSAQAGYDVQFPISRWVAGVFVDYDWMSAQAEHSFNNGVIIGGAVPMRKVSLNNEWSVGGRLGYLFSPDTLVYGLGAYTSQSVTVDGRLAATLLPFSVSLDSGGWSVGAGIETHLVDNWSVKFEYRYSQSDDGGRLFGFGNANVSESLDTQTARLVFTYKFSRW